MVKLCVVVPGEGGSLGKLPPASHETQPGFSRMLSTEAAVTYLAEESHEREKGLVMGSTFFDLTKAFDTVNHDI